MTRLFRSSKRWITRFLLALITGLLCFVVSPILATNTPVKTATRDQLPVGAHGVRPLSYPVGSQLAVNDVSNQTTSSNATENLIQEGKNFYATGRYAEAVKVLQQATTAFKASGDELRLAMTLSNLSLAYQQLGQWDRAENAIAQSLNLLGNSVEKREQGRLEENSIQNPKSKIQNLEILAPSLDVRGRLQWSRGQAQAAFDSWQQAASTHAKVGNQTGEISSRIKQAQALQTLGLYRQAQKTLIEVGKSLQNQPDSALKASGFS